MEEFKAELEICLGDPSPDKENPTNPTRDYFDRLISGGHDAFRAFAVMEAQRELNLSEAKREDLEKSKREEIERFKFNPTSQLVLAAKFHELFAEKLAVVDEPNCSQVLKELRTYFVEEVDATINKICQTENLEQAYRVAVKLPQFFEAFLNGTAKKWPSDNTVVVGIHNFKAYSHVYNKAKITKDLKDCVAAFKLCLRHETALADTFYQVKFEQVVDKFFDSEMTAAYLREENTTEELKRKIVTNQKKPNVVLNTITSYPELVEMGKIEKELLDNKNNVFAKIDLLHAHFPVPYKDLFVRMKEINNSAKKPAEKYIALMILLNKKEAEIQNGADKDRKQFSEPLLAKMREAVLPFVERLPDDPKVRVTTLITKLNTQLVDYTTTGDHAIGRTKSAQGFFSTVQNLDQDDAVRAYEQLMLKVCEMQKDLCDEDRNKLIRHAIHSRLGRAVNSMLREMKSVAHADPVLQGILNKSENKAKIEEVEKDVAKRNSSPIIWFLRWLVNADNVRKEVQPVRVIAAA